MTLDLIKIRRDLHQIPEIGLEEFETQAYLLERIAEMTEGKDFVEQRTWRTGILIYLHGHAPEKTIGWRTDIDGLPIVEETGLDFKSTHEGRMHACGHDMHMTTALGLLDQMLHLKIICSSSSSRLKKMKLVVCLCMRMVPLETGCQMSSMASTSVQISR